MTKTKKIEKALEHYLANMSGDPEIDNYVVKALEEYLPREYGEGYSTAKRELEALGYMNKDGFYAGMLGESALELLSVFAGQGHSEMSASITSNVFDKLSRHEPLGPLTGEPGEWASPDGGDYTQNNRLSSVFKEKSGKSYYLNAITWQCVDEGYGCDSFSGKCCGITSRQYIKEFPFTPKTFVIGINRVDHGTKKPSEENPHYYTGISKDSKNPDAGWEETYYSYKIADPSQLDEVWKYYDKFN